MKKLTLKGITLSDWKSINTTVSFFNDRTFVSAKNGVGKTSLYKAFCWLLSGYCDPNTTKNSDLYDNKEEITPDTPEAVVEAIVCIDNMDYKIKRTAKAKFRRPKGRSEWVKDASDEYKITIDDIKFTQAEFDQWLTENICPANMITYMLSGDFFLSQVIDDKNKARDVMHGLIGAISDDELTGDYTSIETLLKLYPTSGIIEQAKTRKADVEKRLSELPAIIKNKQSALQDLNKTDFAKLKKDIESYKAQIDDIDDMMLGSSKSIEPLIQARDEAVARLSKIREGETFARDAYNASIWKRRAELVAEIDAIASKNNAISCEYERNKKQALKVKKSIDQMSDKLEELKQYKNTLADRKKEIKAAEFSETACPFCGREYDEGMMQVRKTDFYNERQKRIDDVVEKGKKTASCIKDAESEIKELRDRYAELMSEPEYVSGDAALKSLSDYEASVISFDNTDEGKAYESDIKSVVIPEIPSTDRDALTAKKKAVMELLENANMEYGMKRKADEIEAEIKSLQDERRECGVKLAEQERIITKCKEYEQEKAEIVSHRINDKLTYCHIDCWATQKDGTVVPALVVRRNDGVKYETANGASRILMAVDLQRFFCKSLGTAMPCFVDECSVLDSTNLPYSDDAQYIYLYCSENNSLHITNVK